MIRHLVAVAASLGVTLAAGSVAAGAPAFGVSGGASDSGQANSPVNLGIVFTATADEPVVALGFYTAPATTSEVVGLYDSNGSLLTSVTVPLTGESIGGYAYQSITPVTLTGGDTYTLVAFVGDNDWDYGTVGPTTSSGVTYDSHAYFYAQSLADAGVTFGVAGGPSGVYYGPNLEIGGGAVPEPAPWALCLVGIAGLGAMVRSPRRQGAALV